MNYLITFCTVTAIAKFLLFLVNLQSHGPAMCVQYYPFTFGSGFYFILSLLALCFLWQINKEFKNSDASSRTKILISVSSIWFILALFSNRSLKDHNYLTLFFDGFLKLDNFKDLIKLDLIYDSPHILFWLIFFIFIYVVFRNFKLEKYCLIPFLLPYLDLGYEFNDFNYAALFATLFTSFFAVLSKKKISAFWAYNSFLALFTGMTVFFIYNHSSNTQTICSIVIFAILLCIGFCSYTKSKDRSLHKVSWLFTGFLPVFASHMTLGCPCNIFIVIAWVYSAAICGVVLVTGIITAGLTSYLKRFNKKLSQIVFILCTLFFAFLYTADGLLLAISRLKLNTNTFLWFWRTQRLDTMLTTAAQYITLPIVFLIILVLTVSIIFCLKTESMRIKGQIPNFLLMLFLAANTVFFIISLKPLPNIVKDPVVTFVKTQISSPYNNKPIVNPEKTFLEYNVPLKKYSYSQNNSCSSKFNLIHITLESVHSRYLDLFSKNPTWPKMSTLQNRMDFFTNIYSSFPETGNGNFSIISSLYSPSFIYLPFIDTYLAPTAADDFRRAGMSCYLYTSSKMTDSNKIALTRSDCFKEIEDSKIICKSPEQKWTWGVKEEYAVDHILKKAKEHGKEPMFIWYITVYPHQPIPDFLNEENNKPKARLEKYQIKPYKSALNYIDQQLYRLVKGIDNLNLSYPTFISITADHGEMIGEEEYNGVRGHGSSLDLKLTNIPFIIIRPPGFGNNSLNINNRLGSQIDIMPTVMDYLNISINSDRYVQGQSLISDSFKERPIYFYSISGTSGLIEEDTFYSFPIEESIGAKTYKIRARECNKNEYTPIENPSIDVLNEKYRQINGFYILQNRLLNSIQRINR